MKRNYFQFSCALRRSRGSVVVSAIALSVFMVNPFAQAANKLPNYDDISPQNIPVCYDYGCKKQDWVALTENEWNEVAGWFDPPPRNGEEERERIKNAIGWMEVVIGNHAPTFRDKGRNNATKDDFPGQLDCIDESINTTSYLALLAKQGLIRHHNVMSRAHRKALIDQHYSGQLEDKATGETYVVDTWFYDNGKLPVVQTTKDWLSIPIFTSYSDNSQQAN